MSKKTLRIITIISTVLAILCICTLTFAASNPLELTPDQQGTGDIDTVGKRIMGILQAVGIVIAVVVLMVLGIKYMMGSAEEKAEYKKVFMPYLIGAVLLFSAAGIAQAIITFSGNVA